MTLWLSSIRIDEFPADIRDPRLLVGLLSGVVMLFGARLYRLVLITPGVVLGVLFGLRLTSGAAFTTQAVAALCLAVVGAGALYMVERLAVGLVGAVVVAGLARALLPIVAGAGLPWYVPLAAGLLGLLLVPALLRAAIRVLTPLLGAIGVTWALGRPDDLRLLVGLAVVGALFQLIVLRPRERERQTEQ